MHVQAARRPYVTGEAAGGGLKQAGRGASTPSSCVLANDSFRSRIHGGKKEWPKSGISFRAMRVIYLSICLLILNINYFYLFCSKVASHPRFARGRKNYKNYKNYKKKKKKKARHSQIFWPAIRYDVKADPIIMACGPTSREEFPPLMNPNAISMHESNGPIHAARKGKSYLQDMALQGLNWPPCCPDVNPIESMC